MKIKKIVSVFAALTMAASAFASLAVTASAADTYTILYGTAVTDDDGNVTGVTNQTEFTGDANEKTEVTFTDSNNVPSGTYNIDGSVLYAGNGKEGNVGGFTKYFDTPVSSGKVYFSCDYTVSGADAGVIRLLGGNDEEIYVCMCATSSGNGNYDIATINGEKINKYVRLPRGSGYGVELVIDLDANKIDYTLICSNKDTANTTIGTIEGFTTESVKGLSVSKTTYGVYLDDIALYSVASAETKYEYAINYQLDGVNVKVDTASVVEGTEITADTSFKAEDGTKYFITADTAPTLTVLKDGDNVLNVPVRKANDYTITINADVNGTTETLQTIPAVEGESYSYAYPMYIKKGNVVYETAEVRYGDDDTSYGESITSVSENIVKTITYDTAHNNVVLYDELDGSTDKNAGTRASNSSAYNNSSYTSAELEPGIYTVIVRWTYIGRGSTMTIGDTTVISPNSERKNAWYTETVENIIVAEAAPLVWNAGGSKTFDPIDTVLVIKTGNLATAAEEVTVENADGVKAFKVAGFALNGSAPKWTITATKGGVTKSNTVEAVIPSVSANASLGLIISEVPADVESISATLGY